MKDEWKSNMSNAHYPVMKSQEAQLYPYPQRTQMNENNRIYYSKVQDPTKWDVLPDPLFECKSDEDALKAQRYMNGLYSEIEKLKEALSKYADHIDGQWIPHAIEESND